jgi:hypothetical protein
MVPGLAARLKRRVATPPRKSRRLKRASSAGPRKLATATISAICRRFEVTRETPWTPE